MLKFEGPGLCRLCRDLGQDDHGRGHAFVSDRVLAGFLVLDFADVRRGVLIAVPDLVR